MQEERGKNAKQTKNSTSLHQDLFERKKNPQHTVAIMTPQQQTEQKNQQLDDIFPTLATENQKFAKINNNDTPENKTKNQRTGILPSLGHQWRNNQGTKTSKN